VVVVGRGVQGLSRNVAIARLAHTSEFVLDILHSNDFRLSSGNERVVGSSLPNEREGHK